MARVGYSLRLPPAFSYNAWLSKEYFGEEKQSPFWQKWHIFYTHLLNTIIKYDKGPKP